jgi:hypothetical protein
MINGLESVTVAIKRICMSIGENVAPDLFDLVEAENLSSLARLATARARLLLRCDGATLVLRDGDLCHYLDEDAIEPLWKGRRFPAEACISGWVMRHRTYATIEDIRGDMRIPQDAYRSTFVRSLAMVPIDHLDPIGACGAYWGSRHTTTPGQLVTLRHLADAIAIGLRRVLGDPASAAVLRRAPTA